MRRIRLSVITALLTPAVLLLFSVECGENDYGLNVDRNYSEFAACMPPDEIYEDLDFSVSLEESKSEDSIEQYWGDLDEIRRRGVLRVLTRNNGTDYYLYRGQSMGFEYELAKKFADFLGVRLHMVVVPSRAELIPWLQEGRGDIICAGLTVTSARLEKVRFSYAYSEVTRVVVTNKKYGVAEDAEDLTELLFAVRSNGLYVRHLQNIAYDNGYDLVSGDTIEKVRAALIPGEPTIKILEVNPELEDEDIADMVVSGAADAMIVDSDIAELEASYKPSLRVGMEISQPLYHAWAVRRDDGELWLAANSFISKMKNSGYISELHNSYFRKNGAAVKKKRKAFHFVARAGQISPYDDIFRSAGKKYDIDWRLLAALAYQESQFNPQARSPGGALGIMQLMPETASHLGVKNPDSVSENIHAGARYLRTLMDSFGKKAQKKEKLLMALASYNIGHGHIADARKLADKVGLDSDRWFGNVEKAALMLKQHKYARDARYGYFRCDFTLKFVRSVQSRFEQYVSMTKNDVSSLVQNDTTSNQSP